jgi:hypothetical protein
LAPDPIKIDFPKVIAEIESAGITPYKISLMMHRRVDIVIRWKKGQEPKHYEGQMLLMIHAEYVSRETTTKNGLPDLHKPMTQA